MSVDWAAVFCNMHLLPKSRMATTLNASRWLGKSVKLEPSSLRSWARKER